MNIYYKTKKHESSTDDGCLHMRMLKNVSLHVIADSITLAVRFFHLVLLSRNLCFYAGDTHFISF